ncbi:hypothetical protein, conserved [Eimeria necatrix]|uniref:PARP-type domain-containing protein n=1 Tax=Eimeria necatrix TaxID=51315 RepID=U6ML74_9EIME|nr:hypothetical protein, conserved [Eimeria necatrix]CDJ63823.1 hypothetical protein, conserved [Eimeria necatrix]
MAWMIPNELSDIVAVKSSLPTPSTEECFYWPQERQWVPERLVRKLKAAEKKQLQGVKAIVQKAASGQSKCRKCGGAIAKGTLRVGYPTSDPRGAYEVLCCWLHVGCSSELFSMFLQREAEGNLVDQLREDLIVSLTCLESSAGAAAERTAKAEVENGGVKAPPVEDPPPVKKEDPQIRRTRVSSRCSIPNKAEEQDKTDENKEAPSVASTAAPRSTGSSASASSNADDASSDSGGPTNSGGHKVDNEDKKEEALSTRDRLLLERSSCIISTERLCLMADDLSSCEQHRVQEALAEAARRLFFPTEVQAEALTNNVAAEEVIEKLVKREIKGRVASPEGLLLPLLPFQEEGLWWLTQQETSHIKGGILADEMGEEQAA